MNVEPPDPTPVDLAYRNLPALGGERLRFSPGWAAGWWFVPIMSVWRPYQVTREIWQVSSPSPIGWGLVKWWWALWIVGNWFSGRLAVADRGRVPNYGLEALSSLLSVGAALLAILVVRQITEWQAEKAAAGPAAVDTRPRWRGAAPGSRAPVPLDGRLRRSGDLVDAEPGTDLTR